METNMQALALQAEETHRDIQGITITDVEGEEKATIILARIKRMKNELEERRQFLVRPLNEHVKRINAEIKKITEPLERSEEGVKAAIIAYHQSEPYQAILRERDRLQAEAKVAVAEGDMGALEGMALRGQELQAAAPGIIRTDAGRTTTRKVWKFDIQTPGRVPKIYLSPDEKKIREAIKGGVRVIAGVRIYEEDIVVTYGA